MENKNVNINDNEDLDTSEYEVTQESMEDGKANKKPQNNKRFSFKNMSKRNKTCFFLVICFILILCVNCIMPHEINTGMKQADNFMNTYNQDTSETGHIKNVKLKKQGKTKSVYTAEIDSIPITLTFDKKSKDVTLRAKADNDTDEAKLKNIITEVVAIEDIGLTKSDSKALAENLGGNIEMVLGKQHFIFKQNKDTSSVELTLNNNKS